MLRDKMDELKDYVLEHNQYFNNAIAHVYIDQSTGIVSNEEGPVFPNDTLGDYFYLRQQNATPLAFTSLSAATQGLIVSPSMFLVACLRKGSPDVLLSNLINTLRAKCGDNIRFNSFLYNSEDVVLQELARVTEKANVDAALQRIQDVIVSVSFTYSFHMPFQKLSCIQDPCTIC